MFINLRLECKLSIKRKSSQDSNQNLVKKSRLFGFELAFRRRHRNMAIAFFVPPEYGPVVPQQQQEQIPPVRVIHDANNNNVRNNNVLNNLPPDNPTRGLISMFVDEILAVMNRATTNQPTQSPSQQHLQSNQQPNQQDNQNVDNNEGVYGYLPFRHLPDIVTCHAGMSVRYGSGRPTPSQPERLNVSLLPGDNASDVVPLSPRSNIAPACDFEVSLKLDLTMANSTESQDLPPVHDHQVQSLPHELEYRIAGAHLRHIADNYTLQRSRNANQSTFELNVVISVALPAVAILGLGIAYLRRS